jgi:hypothetical protein
MGALVPEEEEVDWEKLFSKGFHPLPDMLGLERTFA